jgi:hypothetical protein
MLGVSRALIEHKTHVDLRARHIKQPQQPSHEERHRETTIEDKQLCDAGFIIATQRPKWLANPVMMTKMNNTWRMCIDYNVAMRRHRLPPLLHL